MRLTSYNIAPYLISSGFLNMESVIRGEFKMTELSSRNCIFKVNSDAESGLFIKQLVSADQFNIYLIQKDATAHFLIHNSDIYKDARAYIPAYYGFDPNSHILVTQYFSEAQNLCEFIHSTKKLNTKHAIEAATILSSFHKDISDEIPQNSSLQFFNGVLPWILNSDYSVQPNNPVLDLVKKDHILTTSLAKTAQEWQKTCLIHGDIKLANFVLDNKSNCLKLIDWETADTGDPLWDVAGIIQTYISTCVLAMVQDLNSTANLDGQHFFNFDSIKPILKKFWGTYCDLQKIYRKNRKEALEKTFKFTAARLLQTATEASQASGGNIYPNTVKLVQLSQNIFLNPMKIADEFVGGDYE